MKKPICYSHIILFIMKLQDSFFDDVARFVRNLVEIQSINPPGEEKEVAEYISEKTIDVLKQASNKQVSIGLQSGSDRVLQSMNRDHSLEDGLRSIELLSSEGFKPIVDYLLGTPDETIEEQWETVDLAKSLQRVAKARFHYLIPLPGTPWRNAKPAPLGEGIQKAIGQLARRGVSTGSFHIQYDQDWDSYS